jgi:hypothetical protein
MKVSVAVIEPVGGHGGMHFYDLSLCRSIVKARADATLFTCDETPVTGTEGFPVRLPYRGIYGRSVAWVRGLRYLVGSLRGLRPSAWCKSVSPEGQRCTVLSAGLQTSESVQYR